MTKIAWLGEDTETYTGPTFVIWKTIRFAKGVAVEVSDERMIAKARGNRFFKVTEAKHEVEAKVEEQSKVEEQDIADKEIKEDHDQRKSEKDYPPVKKKTRRKAKARPAAGASGISTADT